MRKIKTAFLILTAAFLLDTNLLNGKLFVNQVIASCEVEVKRWGMWHTVFTCDSTPNETCSAEETNPDNGNSYRFTCDGKETFRHKDFGADPESISP